MFEPVIGLEIHAQLNTKTKLFSSSSNIFGKEPNTAIDEVSTGQPGTLPIVNKEAIKKAILFGLAIKATIAKNIHFDRKSYFYPDTPRNFQITQFETPIIQGGVIETLIDNEIKKIPISHAHIEDDSGTLKHLGSCSLIDYNRAGTPLLEIVSKPNITSAKEAYHYAVAIKSILEYLDISDANMEMGHLRIDANVSIKKIGEKKLRNKVEIKNINSFSNLEKALLIEIERQTLFYKKNPDKMIESSTFRWNLKKKTNILMRKKESSQDYRYFPEPDIPPINIDPKDLDILKKKIQELPMQRYQRYTKELNLPKENAYFLVSNKKLSDYFEEALKDTSHAKDLCNWIAVEFAGKLKKDITQTSISPKYVAQIVNLINEKTITGKMAKKIADILIKDPKRPPIKIIEENPDFQPIKDENALEEIIDQILKENPQSIQDFKNGRKKALAFLIGKVMKVTKGKASADIVNKIILKKINL